MSDPRRLRGRHDSLTTKLVLFIFVSTLATAVAVTWTSVKSSYVLLSQQYEATFSLALADRSEELRTALTEAISARAADPQLAQALAAGDRGDRLLAQGPDACIAHRLDLFEGLVLRDALGAERARLGFTCPAEVEDATAPLEVQLRAENDHVDVAAPVVNAAGTALGSLHGVVEPGKIGALLAVGAPAGAVFAVLDANGQVWTTSDDSHFRVGETLPAAFLEDTVDPAFGVFRGPTEISMLGAHRPLGIEGGWRLVVAQPSESAFAPVFSTVGRVVALDLAIVLLFSVLAYRVTVAVVRPLEALADGARRITQGEYQVELPEPETHDEIGLVTRTFNDMACRLRGHRAELEEQHRQLSDRNAELQSANEVLEQLSITDSLTKLHNHRYFQEALTREIKRVSRTHDSLAMLMIDIDDFKRWNDQYGHAEGDAVLCRIAVLLNDAVRESDVLARYGGEEFVVLATGTDLEGARFLAEKLRTRVAEARFDGPASGEAHVTISVGVALFQENRRDLFLEADRALYRAKAEGKNCVVVAEDTA